MDAKTILETFAAETGWDDDSKLSLLCSFIDERGETDALEAFLEDAADAEADEDGEGEPTQAEEDFCDPEDDL